MEIRKAEASDAKTLDHLLTLLIQDERKYDDTIDANFKVNNFYENYIYDETKCLFVAVINEEIVGYIYGFFINNDNVAYLDALFVKNNFRNQTIGEQLIIKFREWVKSKKITNIKVRVCSENYNAKKLYAKLGFKAFDETLILKEKID